MEALNVTEKNITVPLGIPIGRQPVIDIQNPWQLHCLECGDQWGFEKRTPFSGKFSAERCIVISCPSCTVPHVVEVSSCGYQYARCII